MHHNGTVTVPRLLLLTAALLALMASPAAASFDLWSGTMDLHSNDIVDAASITMDGAIALGQKLGSATALNDSIALGRSAEADADNAIAIGNGSSVSSDEAIAIGRSSAAGLQGIAIGFGSGASGSDDSIAIGTLSQVSGEDAVALGDNADASAFGAVAIGQSAEAAQQNTTTFGSFQDERYDVNVTGNVTVHGLGGVMMPPGVVIGDGTTTAGDRDALAVGKGANAARLRSTAIGTRSSVSGNTSTAVGSHRDDDQVLSLDTSGPESGNITIDGQNYEINLTTVNSSGVAYRVDDGSLQQDSEGDTFIVDDRKINITDVINLADDAGSADFDLLVVPPTASGHHAMALGTSANASADAALAIGQNALAPSTGAVAIGDNASIVEGNAHQMAIGKNSRAENVRSLALGYDSSALGADSVAIGFNSTSDLTGTVAIGKYSSVLASSGVAIGSYSSAGNTALALGSRSSAADGSAVAIGPYSSATASTAVAIGWEATAGKQDQATFGSFDTQPYDVNVTGNLSVAEMAKLKDHGGTLPTCNAESEGGIMYNGSHWGCDGANWNPFY